MDKNKLFEQLLNKSSFSIAELKKLKAEYPYFSMARILYLKALKESEEMLFQKEINNNAVFISNRKQLFHLLHSFDQSDIAKFIQQENEKKIDEIPQKPDLLDFSISETPISETKAEAPVKTEESKIESKTEDVEADSSAFTDWLDKVENKNNEKDKFSLIDRFVNEDIGVIRADKKTNLQGDVSKGSVQEDESFITDTLAKIYIKQGLYSKAIYAYEKLCLKYPEKSIYFASQIEEIKKVTNK